MRLSLVLLCSIPCVGSAQPKLPQLPPKRVPPSVDRVTGIGQEGWKPSKMTLVSLADRVAKATADLKGVSAQMHIDVTTPEGRAMFATPSVRLSIRDKNFHRVDFVAIQRVPFSCTSTFDGKVRQVRMDKDVKRIPGGGALAVATSVSGDRLVTLFDVDFPRLMFQGLTDGRDAWRAVLTGWGRGVDGYKAVVEERTVVYQGNRFLNYRVRAERSASAAKKLGTSTFEIILDGKRFLPVTVRNIRKDPKGQSWSAIWAAMYRFNVGVTAKDISIG